MATTKAKTAPKAKAEVTEKAPAKKAAPKAAKGNARGADAFAVIMTGGKQYKVKVGDVLKIEKMIGEYKVGDTIAFDQVLLIDEAGTTNLGAPTVSGAVVEGEIKEIGRDPKVMVIHYKQKSKYFKKYGHRQPFFKVAITSIA
ncbi:MAG: 50S ribosomal protein L21 [bacterium]|nr:50S ribosomal protein L21 [bacterium]